MGTRRESDALSRCTAPDAVLDAILHRAVEREFAGLPLGVCVRLGLGRDPTVDEVERMQILAEAGRRFEQGRLDLAETMLAIAEEREAVGRGFVRENSAQICDGGAVSESRSTIPQAGVFHVIAREAYERTWVSTTPESVKHDSLTAIMFAVIALEAFINELAEVLQGTYPPPVPLYATLANELEESKAQLQAKYRLPHIVFAGRPYDRGKLPWQNFELLIRVRNELAHPKPTTWHQMPDRWGAPVPKWVEALKQQGLTDDDAFSEEDGSMISPWSTAIATPQAARSACNVAFDVRQAIVELLPKDWFLHWALYLTDGGNWQRIP